jgi:hypothetical protein
MRRIWHHSNTARDHRAPPVSLESRRRARVLLEQRCPGLAGIRHASKSGQNPERGVSKIHLSTALCNSLGYLEPDRIPLESVPVRRIPWRVVKKWPSGSKARSLGSRAARFCERALAYTGRYRRAPGPTAVAARPPARARVHRAPPPAVPEPAASLESAASPGAHRVGTGARGALSRPLRQGHQPVGARHVPRDRGSVRRPARRLLPDAGSYPMLVHRPPQVALTEWHQLV